MGARKIGFLGDGITGSRHETCLKKVALNPCDQIQEPELKRAKLTTAEDNDSSVDGYSDEDI